MGAVLDLLIAREHDKIADVDVARPCHHVQDGIGDIFWRQPSSAGDALGDRRAVCDLPKIIQHDTADIGVNELEELRSRVISMYGRD
jgi:hypothetical protein